MAAIMDKVVAAGGPRAEVRYLRAGAWRLKWTAPRVEAFTTVLVRANGRTTLDDGELRIDGVACKPARGPAELAEVLADPDAYLAEIRRPQEPVKPVDAATMPTRVRVEVARMTKGLPAEAVTVGRDRGHWVVVLRVQDLELRMWLHRRNPAMTAHWSIAEGGVVVSWRYAGGLDEALSELGARSAGSGAPGRGAVTGEAAGARRNSVEVRRASVYRI